MSAIMRIIAIDPGQSTGIAVVTKHENFVLNELTTVKEDQIEFVLYLYPSTKIVIESAAAQGNRRQIILVDRIRTICQKECKTALLSSISPGNWKPFSEANRWTHPDAKTQHEADAYNIARFHILQSTKIDIGVIRK